MRVNNITRLTLITAYLLLVSCATTNTEGTLASLSDVKFEVKEEKVDGSLEKAMASYEKFLKETPETEMTPEALRRLADLKIQKEYAAEEVVETQQETSTTDSVSGALPVAADTAVPVADSASQATDIQTPDTSFVPVAADKDKQSIATTDGPIADLSEG